VVLMYDIYEEIIDLTRRRGFIWPTSECYGSVAGFIDYGPLGAMLKRRVEDLWRSFYVYQEGYYEIECPTIAQESVFIGSGHVKEFADKMVQCPHCKEFLRADHIAEAHKTPNAQTMSSEILARTLMSLPCPSCEKIFGPVEVFGFNLMFKTAIGPGTQRTGYLRPETAQGMFTDFQRLLRFYRDKLPFGAVQIGKAYRNEISPRQGMIRLREFNQAEAEIFVHPMQKNHPEFSRYRDYIVPLYSMNEQNNGLSPKKHTMDAAVKTNIIANEYVAYYIALTHELLTKLGIKEERMRFRQHLRDEMAHYASDCWDAEIYSDRFGWVETVGIADRTDYDLNAHAKESGKEFKVFVPFDVPKTKKQLKISADMGKLGPLFKVKAKLIADALKDAIPGETSTRVIVEGEEYEVPNSLFSMKEEIIELRGEEVVPHVIEPSYGIDRMIYAVLECSYYEDEVEGETRKVLRLPARIAPVQVAVLPLMNKEGLDSLASELNSRLRSNAIFSVYDDSGAIGRRYRRHDEIGTPFAVTLDFDTIKDKTVTIRERDSMKQVRVNIDELETLIPGLIHDKIQFESLL